MTITRDHKLVTVHGVSDWQEAGKIFQTRYDLIRPSSGSNSPVYNCIYLLEGVEYILIAVNTRHGTVKDRELSLFPAILYSHHPKFGDGSMVFYHAEDQSLSTWAKTSAGSLEMLGRGSGVDQLG